PNALMMPHNPTWYLTLHETGGFTKARHLVCLEGGAHEAPVPAPDRTVRAVELILKRCGVTIRSLDMSRLTAEVEPVQGIYNAAWERNWGFIPMTDAEIDNLAKAFRPVVIPTLVPFVETADGRTIAFGLALPDLNQALAGNRSGGMFPAALTMLWKLRRR